MYYKIIKTWNEGYPCDHTDIIFVTSDLVQALKEFSSKRELCSKPSKCDSKFSLYEWTDERTYRVIDECDNYDRESEQTTSDQTVMKSFYVIIYDPNRKAFVPYDVIPYLEKCYYEEKDRPGTLEEFKTFIKRYSTYQWWSRCEYEIILSDWPNMKLEKKIDVHFQVLMNLDTIAEILMESVNDG